MSPQRLSIVLFLVLLVTAPFTFQNVFQLFEYWWTPFLLWGSAVAGAMILTLGTKGRLR